MRGPGHHSRGSANQSHSVLRQLFMTKRTIAIDLRYQSRTTGIHWNVLAGTSSPRGCTKGDARRHSQARHQRTGRSENATCYSGQAEARQQSSDESDASRGGVQQEGGWHRAVPGQCYVLLGFINVCLKFNIHLCGNASNCDGDHISAHHFIFAVRNMANQNGAQTSLECDCVIVACHKKWCVIICAGCAAGRVHLQTRHH